MARPAGEGDAYAHVRTLGNSPSGRTARMTRKAMWPARSCQPGLMWAPIAWATPRTSPPANVPHRLPRPPMITASKPKIRRAGPIAGSKLARHAGDRHYRQRERHGERENVSVVEAHELRYRLGVGDPWRKCCAARCRAARPLPQEGGVIFRRLSRGLISIAAIGCMRRFGRRAPFACCFPCRSWLICRAATPRMSTSRVQARPLKPMAGVS
jgi:hypothetical protein